jgi:hypothetical protein
MTIKKITAVLLSVLLICTVFCACSSKDIDAVETTKAVEEVTDADDSLKVETDDESYTVELTDNDGNVLTIVPIYNSDGVSVIAGYVESAKDKTSKDLTQKEYQYIKAVVALDVDSENNCVLKYSDNKLQTIEALSDDKGYIIALQDALDIDKDKDTKEYFKVVTKLDSKNNLFIKLDKDEKGNLINVTVQVEEKNNKKTITVVDSTGKKTTATSSTSAKNLAEVVKEKDTTTTTTKKSESNKNTTTSNKKEQTTSTSKVDYVSIVLKNNGKVACDAKNVTVNEASALNGGTEIIVDGAGEYNKYYVTSETGTFAGQIEFRLSVDEEVEVKFNNVSISTSKKTAVKFTNVDSEADKETDSEESGVGGNSGNSANAPAPSVELSITGENSFKANGSGKNGTIYSECKLAIKGHGSADIDGGQSLSGICSTESITIKNATLNIESRAKQGISCDKKVTVSTGATINISSIGDGIHCNKFEFNGSESEAEDSVISIKSMNPNDSADGIDADEQIIINGGTLDVVAPTSGKYALKVRKVIKGNSKGIFKINGGTVTASGSQNTPLQSGSQKAVLVTSTKATVFTVGKVSSQSTTSFICSPVSAKSVSNANGDSKDISWSSNAGKVVF